MIIRQIISNIIKNLYFKIRFFFDKWHDEYNLYKLKKRPDILIGENVRINSSAIIEIKGGGGIFIGDNSEILDGVIIQTYGGVIKVGKNCSINSYSILYGHGNLTIGNDVLIAGHCMLIPNNHVFDDINITIREQGCKKKGIKIDSNVWIAHSCSILDGVTIGEGVIIAAGSVVNKSVKSNTIVGGIPAKLIKHRNE